MNLAGVKKILRERKDELKRRFKVKKTGAFGSYVRGEQKESSDLDILVEFYETPTLLEFIELENYLSDLVDLVMKRALKPSIKEQVLKEVVYV